MTALCKFTPINAAHAIVEAGWLIAFSSPLTIDEIALMKAAAFVLKDDLPKIDEIKKFEAIVDAQNPGSPTMKQEDGGFEMQRIRPDGAIDWALRVANDTISVHCFDYTRWNDFQEKAFRFFSVLCQPINASSNTPVLTALRYTDRFICEDDANYNAESLLKRNSGYLPENIFQAGSLWHSHSGWFEQKSFLNQLNIESGYVHLSGHQKTTVTLQHNIVFRSTDSDKNLFPTEGTDLKPVAEKMHIMNKQVLAQLLVPSLVKQINLNIKES